MVAWLAVYAGAAGAYLLRDFIYHRWIKDPDVEKKVPQEVGIPRTDDGAPVSVFYGRVRVRSPVLAWCGVPESEPGDINNTYPTGTYCYQLDLFFVVGEGFDGGTHQFHNLWVGDRKFSPGFSSLTAGTEGLAEVPAFGEEPIVGGFIRWYNGNSSQEHVNSGGSAVTYLGTRMLTYWPASSISGYRGVVSVFCSGSGANQWFIGSQPNVQQYSFEVSSYLTTGATIPATGIYAQVGQDANPINALYDILVGKLSIPVSLIDSTTFSAAAVTLYQEGHGYSRVLDEFKDGTEYVLEILRQIDAALYLDESSGTIKIKLVRNDYNVATIPHITKATAHDLVNFASGGWTGLPNAIRVTFPDRTRDYNDHSAVAQNPANAVGQDGIARWVHKDFPGVTTEALASRLAWRELAATSRPIMKCRAIVDRSFVRVAPGDAVKVTWSSPDLSNVVFRVAAVDRGTLADGRIGLDLIQDYFYVYRQIPPQPGGLERPRLNPGMNLGFG